MLHLHTAPFLKKTKCCKQWTGCFMRESLSYPNSTLLQLACTCTHADKHKHAGTRLPYWARIKGPRETWTLILHNMFRIQTHSYILVLGNWSTVHSMASDKPCRQTSQNYATQTMCRAKPRKSRWQLTREIERETTQNHRQNRR